MTSYERAQPSGSALQSQFNRTKIERKDALPMPAIDFGRSMTLILAKKFAAQLVDPSSGVLSATPVRTVLSNREMKKTYSVTDMTAAPDIGFRYGSRHIAQRAVDPATAFVVARLK